MAASLEANPTPEGIAQPAQSLPESSAKLDELKAQLYYLWQLSAASFQKKEAKEIPDISPIGAFLINEDQELVVMYTHKTGDKSQFGTIHTKEFDHEKVDVKSNRVLQLADYTNLRVVSARVVDCNVSVNRATHQATSEVNVLFNLLNDDAEASGQKTLQEQAFLQILTGENKDKYGGIAAFWGTPYPSDNAFIIHDDPDDPGNSMAIFFVPKERTLDTMTNSVGKLDSVDALFSFYESIRDTYSQKFKTLFENFQIDQRVIEINNEIDQLSSERKLSGISETWQRIFQVHLLALTRLHKITGDSKYETHLNNIISEIAHERKSGGVLFSKKKPQGLVDENKLPKAIELTVKRLLLTDDESVHHVGPKKKEDYFSQLKTGKIRDLYIKVHDHDKEIRQHYNRTEFGELTGDTFQDKEIKDYMDLYLKVIIQLINEQQSKDELDDIRVLIDELDKTKYARMRESIKVKQSYYSNSYHRFLNTQLYFTDAYEGYNVFKVSEILDFLRTAIYDLQLVYREKDIKNR